MKAVSLGRHGFRNPWDLGQGAGPMFTRTQMDRSPPLDSCEVVQAATACLGNSPYPLIRRVSCEYNEGVLFLRGRVACYYHKQLAQEAVARIGIAMEVVNRIEVLPYSAGSHS
jgi:hypothetical protein